MPRDWYINGETLVRVKGNPYSAIANIQELGLAQSPIIVTFNFKHRDINIDAWGGETGPPAEVQAMLIDATITMNLLHFDDLILDACASESLGGIPPAGQLPRAGARLGNNLGRFGAGAGNLTSNHYIGLNLSSPVKVKPFRFYYTYLVGSPITIPLGTEKSAVQVTFRAIPYTMDPYGGSLAPGAPANTAQPFCAYSFGAQGAVLFDNGQDT